MFEITIIKLGIGVLAYLLIQAILIKLALYIKDWDI